jgi:hypothetical protein
MKTVRYHSPTYAGRGFGGTYGWGEGMDHSKALGMVFNRGHGGGTGAGTGSGRFGDIVYVNGKRQTI